MFKRKLLALEYYDREKFDANSEQDRRKLIVWLEDQAIRHYLPTERGPMRDTDSTNWPQTFQQYLNDLLCPYEWTETNIAIDWLLNLAVRLEFEDSHEKYNADFKAQRTAANGNGVPQFVQQNPLDSLDFDSQEFKEGVVCLAKYLKVPEHPNHLVTLQGICQLIENTHSGEKIKEKHLTHSQVKVAKVAIADLDSINLGFASGDKILDKAMKVLRLLYINDLKELQKAVNRTLVRVQAVTANPKTDTALGKTGHG